MSDPVVLNRIDIVEIEREARRLRAEAFRNAFIAAWRWLRGLSTAAVRPTNRPVTR